MKTLIIITICLLSSFALLGQIPQAFNYQAAVRNLDGEIQYETAADFEIEILQNGNSIYSEQHLELNTGQIGVVNFKVGGGTNPSSDFSQIDWSLGALQIRVSLNGEEMNAADIVAVPFALYAQSSGGDDDWSQQGDSVLFVENKRIGIGVLDPGFSIDVNGTGSFGKGEISQSGDILLNLNSDRPWQFRQSGQGAGSNLELFNVSTNKDFFINTEGGVGIGTINPSVYRLNVNGSTSVGSGENSQDGSLLLVLNSERLWTFRQFGEGAGAALELASVGGGGNKNFLITTDGNVGIGTTTPEQKLDVNGRIRTKTLEITGGSDIKEDVNSIDALEAGDIVVIDENNPGNVRRTNEEYDRKVAGIISGANGINPGLSLSQDDVLEGEFPLTMLGRVYVKVTGMVEMGDMLTTSSKPGFAMSVKDYSKAHGTVIGKAMTSNESGEGLVLVLVNLQ